MNGVLIKPKGIVSKCEIREGEHTLHDLQELVGGWVQALYPEHNVAVLCDEEGVVKGAQHSCAVVINGVLVGLVGNVVVVGTDGNDFVSLNDETAEDILNGYSNFIRARG